MVPDCRSAARCEQLLLVAIYTGLLRASTSDRSLMVGEADVTGVWEALRTTGTLGPAGVVLVYETVDAVRRFDRYPPPEGADHWTESGVQEFAHDFLFAEGGSERLAKLAALATDEDSFERVLETAVRNVFRMQARRTETGAAMRALAHAVQRDPEIVVTGSTRMRTWSLREHEGKEPYSGSVVPLIEAAYAVPNVRRARWSPESTRRPPIAESDSLRRVLRSVLSHARAPVAPRVVLDVILARFPFATSGEIEFRDDLLPVTSLSGDTRLLALEAWEQLTDNERLVVGVLDLSVREMAQATGLSRSTAQRAATAAREVLATFLVDLDDPAGVVAALGEISATLRVRGTARAGSASKNQEEN